MKIKNKRKQKVKILKAVQNPNGNLSSSSTVQGDPTLPPLSLSLTHTHTLFHPALLLLFMLSFSFAIFSSFSRSHRHKHTTDRQTNIFSASGMSSYIDGIFIRGSFCKFSQTFILSQPIHS